MNQTEIKKVLSEMLADAIVHAEEVNNRFEIEPLLEFKTALKKVRSFMSFVRAHYENDSFHLPEKIRSLYNIAGSVIQFLEENNATGAEALPEKKKASFQKLMDSAAKEWSKNYNKSHFKKLELMLTGLNYNNIPSGFVDNFFNNLSKATAE